MKPLNNRVILKRSDVNEEGGFLHIPETHQNKPLKGVVVACGDNSIVSVGDTVLFGRHVGTEIEINKEELFIIKENELFAIL